MRNLRAVTFLACLAAVGGTLVPGSLATDGRDTPGLDPSDADLPPILDGLSLPEGLQALAVSRAGDKAALAVLADPEAKSIRSMVRLHSSGDGEPAGVELLGVVRALLFVEPGPILYAIQHRPAKKREGETVLVTIDFDTPEVVRAARLPPSARGLAYWPRENALLVAARDQIRTILLPLARSGPLFRFPGENLAVVALGGTRILVGQELALLDADLADPPDRDRFPSRQSIEVPSPIVSLALSPDGTRAFAGLADNTLGRIGFDPLRLEVTGTGILPSRPVVQTVPDVVEPETEAPPDPEPPATLPPTVSIPEPAPEVRHEPLPEPAPATSGESLLDDGSTRPGAGPDTTERPAAHGAFESPPVRDVPEPRDPPPPPPDTSAQARGTLTGPASDLVLAVVFLGPDNILREAARSVPSSAGRWEIEGLEQGRYRVQLDGGGDRVLVTEPRFLILDIVKDGPTLTGDFNVLGTR